MDKDKEQTSAAAARQSFPPPALTCQGLSHANMQSAGKGGMRGRETCRTGTCGHASFWGADTPVNGTLPPMRSAQLSPGRHRSL